MFDRPFLVVYKEPMKTRYDRRALRRLRVARGLGLSDLATRAKTSKANLSMIDRGYQEPKASTLARLASALDAPVQEFFEVSA